MLTLWRIKISATEKAVGLAFHFTQEFGQGQPPLIGRGMGIPSEITQRLKMDASNARYGIERKAQNRADVAGINPRHESRHQNDSDTMSGTGFDRRLFLLQERSPADSLIHRIFGSVELQKYRKLCWKRLVRQFCLVSKTLALKMSPYWVWKLAPTFAPPKYRFRSWDLKRSRHCACMD